MIKKIKEVTCDYCSQGIDYFDESCTDKEVKRIIKNGCAIVDGSLIFCCSECKQAYKREMIKKERP